MHAAYLFVFNVAVISKLKAIRIIIQNCTASTYPNIGIGCMAVAHYHENGCNEINAGNDNLGSHFAERVIYVDLYVVEINRKPKNMFFTQNITKGWPSP